MVWFLVGSLGLVALTIALLIYGIHGMWCEEAAVGIAFFTAIAALVFIVVFSIMAFGYKGASVKARLINREYDAEYSTEEIFYASDVIDTIKELNRSRSESRSTIDLNVTTK
jgi:hypothetical protein